MMKDFKHIVKESKKVRLSPDVHLRVGNVLKAHMNAYPLDEKFDEELPWWAPFLAWGITVRTVPVAVLTALIIGGGVSYAAEGALPGDTLYPVKLNLNEKVMGKFAFSQKARVNVETRLAERRLEEAEELAANGRLNENLQAHIEKSFEAHASNVAKELVAITDKSDIETAAEVSSQFVSTLQTHGHILIQVGGEEDGVLITIQPLVKKVAEHAKNAAQVRSDAESKLKERANSQMQKLARSKEKEAVQVIDEVRVYLVGNPKVLDAAGVAKLTAHLKVADQAIAAGKVAFHKEAYNDAYTNFQKAERIGEEAKLFLRAQKALKVQIVLPSVWGGDNATTSPTPNSSSTPTKSVSPVSPKPLLPLPPQPQQKPSVTPSISQSPAPSSSESGIKLHIGN